MTDYKHNIRIVHLDNLINECDAILNEKNVEFSKFIDMEKVRSCKENFLIEKKKLEEKCQ